MHFQLNLLTDCMLFTWNSYYMKVKDEPDLKSPGLFIRQLILEIIGLHIQWTDIMVALRCPNNDADWPAVTDT